MWVTEHNATNKPHIQGSQLYLLFNLSYTLAFTAIFRDTVLLLPEGSQDYYSKTCLKRNAIVPVFFFSVFTGFRFTKDCVLIKQSTKNMIA